MRFKRKRFNMIIFILDWVEISHQKIKLAIYILRKKFLKEIIFFIKNLFQTIGTVLHLGQVFIYFTNSELGSELQPLNYMHKCFLLYSFYKIKDITKIVPPYCRDDHLNLSLRLGYTYKWGEKYLADQSHIRLQHGFILYV